MVPKAVTNVSRPYGGLRIGKKYFFYRDQEDKLMRLTGIIAQKFYL